jgi:hypothetical protein
MSVMEKSLEADNTTDTDQEKHVSEAAAQDDIENDDSQYLSGIRLGVLLVGLCLAIFLMGLVRLPATLLILQLLTVLRITPSSPQ